MKIKHTSPSSHHHNVQENHNQYSKYFYFIYWCIKIALQQYFFYNNETWVECAFIHF